ncbi:hypothetical protein ACQCSX_18365 [Pseudarthrobacter sp. P1]|uniref:hypothetical protein n=1 Tax=Pseudarthrobacter sp. P1 TaxID=3418418 RepID=UPI003CEB0291
MHSTILQFATATPSDDGTLRPGLDPDQVSPGFLGFIITFSIVVVMFFLIRDMVKRIRRVRYREQVQVGGSHGPDAEDLDEATGNPPNDDGANGAGAGDGTGPAKRG